MRHTPRFLLTDPGEVRRLIQQHPWATFVSPARGGLVASHYPVLLDPIAPASDDISIVSHFGRPDEVLHELGQHQILVIIQGPHDYISPTWYPPGELVPTWNHVTAHLYGTPEILTDDENYAMLGLLTEHFERHHPGGRSLTEDEPGTRRQARGTVGLRMRVDRFDARAKLSQNKPAPVQQHIAARLAEHNPALAAEMGRHRAGNIPSSPSVEP